MLFLSIHPEFQQILMKLLLTLYADSSWISLVLSELPRLLAQSQSVLNSDPASFSCFETQKFSKLPFFLKGSLSSFEFTPYFFSFFLFQFSGGGHRSSICSLPIALHCCPPWELEPFLNSPVAVRSLLPAIDIATSALT